MPTCSAFEKAEFLSTSAGDLPLITETEQCIFDFSRKAEFFFFFDISSEGGKDRYQRPCWGQEARTLPSDAGRLRDPRRSVARGRQPGLPRQGSVAKYIKSEAVS